MGMADRKKVSAVAVRDKQGTVEVVDLAVLGENVENLRWKHITDRPFELDSGGKIPKSVLPTVQGSEISGLKWAHITDRPFDLDAAGKIPKEKIPTVSWAEVTGKPTLQSAVFSAGTTAPADKSLLWIDTTAGTGGLKYWNGSAWVTVPVAYA